jgi:hypothetical protein
MKELEPKKIDDKEVVREIHDQKEVYVGSSRLPNGCKYWELNTDTMRISLAVYENERVELSPVKDLFGNVIRHSPITRKDLVTKDNAKYCIALNAKNAKRKFLKMLKHESEKNKLKEEESS